MKRKPVGTSADRTPGKHALLDSVLGKQKYAFWCRTEQPESQLLLFNEPPKKSMMRQPFVIIDLCAGDGVDTEESGTCSPKIIQGHSQWIRRQLKSEQASIVILVEKGSGTFDILSNSPHYSDCILIKGDSNSDEVVSQIKSILNGISRKCPVFIHHDPNSVASWCLRKEYLTLSDFVTTMVTMGCNASGIKAWYKIDERTQWFEKFNILKRQVKDTNGRLDLCLAALNGDGHRWAYSLSVPYKWRENTSSAINTAFSKWTKGIELEWMNDSPIEFDKLVHKLFLTKKEFEEMENEYNA